LEKKKTAKIHKKTSFKYFGNCKVSIPQWG